MKTEKTRSGQARCAERWVVLGASNVALHLSALVQVLLESRPRPLDLRIAGGHGRAYGSPSRFLARQLGSILDCGLWDSLQDQPFDLPQWSLVTDVGNDLVYGRGPDEVFHAVTEIVSRLQFRSQTITVGGLPMENLKGTRPWQFRLLQRLFFPGTRLTQKELIDRADELDQRLREWVRTTFSDNSVQYRPVQRHWYGWDPIHFRRRWAPEAWRALLLQPRGAAGWENICDDSVAIRCRQRSRLTFAQHLSIYRSAPEQRSVFGRSYRTDQPSLICSENFFLSLY